jgi:hypothetical protein
METKGRSNRVLLVIAAFALAALALSVLALLRAQETRAQGTGLRQRIHQLVLEHQRLESELTHEPFAETGASPLEAYLARIRRDGAARHVEMRHRLTALAENNVALLTLAEAYEPFAGDEGYAAPLRALRSYVITWNERWNGLFEIFMAGGNLASGELPFPKQFAEFVGD